MGNTAAIPNIILRFRSNCCVVTDAVIEADELDNNNGDGNIDNDINIPIKGNELELVIRDGSETET